jgi:hypothetical protein
MPPRGVTSAKRKRQYEHVKDSELQRGVGEDRAEEIAARTVNKQRAQAGETKSARGGRKSTGRARSAGARKTSGRRTSGGKKSSSGRKSGTRRAASKKR